MWASPLIKTVVDPVFFFFFFVSIFPSSVFVKICSKTLKAWVVACPFSPLYAGRVQPSPPPLATLFQAVPQGHPSSQSMFFPNL